MLLSYSTKQRKRSIVTFDTTKNSIWNNNNVRSFCDHNVNHSVNFIDPESGCHTQNIENLWWQIKSQLPETYSKHNKLYLHLAEYMWRCMKDKSNDMFIQFLKDAAKYYKGNVSLIYFILY